MKNGFKLLTCALFALLCGHAAAQISTNKAFFLGANNALRNNETNFFAVNSNLLNASVASGGGGGFTGNPSQFSSASGTSNIISGVSLTNINAQGISNSGYSVVVGNQTNSNTFRIYQGNFADLMDWYGTGGSAASMDHLANFTTLGNVAAASFRDNQGFSSDGLGDVLANIAFFASNSLTARTNFANYEVVSNTLTTSNLSSAGRSFAVSDGAGDGLFLNYATGIINLYNSGNITAGSPSGVFLDGNGGVDVYGTINASNGMNIPAGGSFNYTQAGSMSSVLYSSSDTANTTLQELWDMEPLDYLHANNSDRLVVTASSNNANIRLQGDGSVSAARYWESTTNITGQPSFVATMYCTRITWSSNGGNCQVTLPSNNLASLVLPTAGAPFRGWNAANAMVAGGNGLMPYWMTGQYTVENLSSNSGYSLSVCLADHTPFTNWGATNLVIPPQMGCRFTSPGTNGGTNIAAELFALSPAPTYTGLTVSGSLSASNVTATNLILPWRYVTNNTFVTNTDSILFCYGTNEYITNLQTIVGKPLTVIVKNTNGSVILTNWQMLFTVPGLGTVSNAVYLSGGSPSNAWTGIYDGTSY